MKIGPLDNKPAVAPTINERKTAPAGAARADDAGSAKVDLSATAAALKNGPVDASFDTAKVERIAQAIRDGKFEVNAGAIADKLISNAQELLGKSGR